MGDRCQTRFRMQEMELTATLIKVGCLHSALLSLTLIACQHPCLETQPYHWQVEQCLGVQEINHHKTRCRELQERLRALTKMHPF